MDKTLEIIMVAVALLVSTVIVVGLLQGRANSLGGFADNKTQSASCGIATSNFESKVDCGSSSVSSSAKKIFNDNSQCWQSTTASNAKTDVCS